MIVRGLAFAAALTLWGMAAAAQEELPEGYPPKMGEITGTLGGEAVVWETFDFSVGAFDASAWAEKDFNTRRVTANLMGYPPGKPDEKSGRLFVRAGFGKALRTGRAQSAEVLYLQGPDRDGPRLSSVNQKAQVIIDSIGPKVENSYSRRVTGRVHAQLCPVDWPGQKCRVVKVSFDTDMQMDSELPIKP